MTGKRAMPTNCSVFAYPSDISACGFPIPGATLQAFGKSPNQLFAVCRRRKRPLCANHRTGQTFVRPT